MPLMVIGVPATAKVGDRLVRPGRTVKLTPLLGDPVTVTITFPVVAPAGTGTVTEVALQFVGVAGVPLNVTVLVPCVAPKLSPRMVMGVPTGALDGDRELIVTAGFTVKPKPLLAEPPTVATTFPEVALTGTGI